MSIKLKQITPANIIHYIVGNIRYFFFKRKVKNLDLSFIENDMDWEDSHENTKASHTQEQFLYRIYLVKTQSPKCLSQGACIICGCDTPELFFANKTCDGKCYPEMMKDKEEWEFYKKHNEIDMQKVFSEIKPYLIEKKIISINN